MLLLSLILSSIFINCTWASTFGYRVGTQSESEWAASTETITMTYYEGTSMYECKVNGTNEFDVVQICDSNSLNTRECISSEDKNAIQISISENGIPIEEEGQTMDDIFITALIINTEYINIALTQIGDRGGSSNINEVYFDLDADIVSREYVDEIPECISYA